jgi:hypothetical protein
MAQLKHCNKCGKTKSTTEFSKKTASPDGLQTYCKSCNSKDNFLFRKEINPTHHTIWQKVNRVRVNEIVKKYQRADKNGLIYYIKNPDGQFYIGYTKAHLNVRMGYHKTQWNRFISNKPSKCNLPKLWESVSKWGWDKHEIDILLEFGNIDRKELKGYESECIKTFKDLGISLNIAN